jgi:hypothetical protein
MINVGDIVIKVGDLVIVDRVIGIVRATNAQDSHPDRRPRLWHTVMWANGSHGMFPVHANFLKKI